MSKTSKKVFNKLQFEKKLTPIVKTIYGSLVDSKIDESDYKKHLEDKYL